MKETVEECQSNRLFGREKETRKLLDAYERCCCSSSSPSRQKELVLISGKSGTGKTALAKSLRYNEKLVLVTGKFDQRCRPEPYSPFVAAFTEWANLPEKQELQQLDPLVLDTIPALKSLTENNAVTDSDTKNMNNTSRVQKQRFLTAFRDFIKSICSQQCPLVLFLDDLQWADQGSLELLSTLACSSIEGFMLLGACRGNEVAINDPVAVTFRQLEEQNVQITNIALHNFTLENVREMLSENFPSNLDEQNIVKVSNAVYKQTEGNVFYIVRLLKLYQEQSALSKGSNTAKASQREYWNWDIELVPNLKRNVSDVMREALQELPEDIQVVLQTASCLGAIFYERHLEVILDQSDVRDALELAAKHDIIVYSLGGECKFTHDRLQEAAYKLIPTDERARVHARIGQKLVKGLPSKELDDYLFLVVNQLGSGLSEIQDPQDQADLAELCLRAGKKAVTSSAFSTASEYFDIGIKALQSSSQNYWRTNYSLSLALFNAAAEVEYCNGRFDKMSSQVEQVLEHARSFEDKLQTYSTQVFSLGAQQRYAEAIDTAFFVLGELGEPFPPRAGKLRVMLSILKTKRMLRKLSPDDILKLPTVTDSTHLAAFHMMNLVYLYIFFTRQAYVPILSTRCVQATLKHGLCGMGSSGFGMYGMLLCGVLGEIDEGYKYCQVSLRILEKFEAKAYVARVYVPVWGMVTHWKKPVRDCLGKLKEAHQAGFETGDIEFASLSAALYCFMALVAGAPLPALREDICASVEQMKVHNQSGILSLMLPAAQLVDGLMGNSKDPCVLTGEFMDEPSFLRKLEGSRSSAAVSAVHLRRLVAAYTMNNFDLAFDGAEGSKSMEKEVISSLSTAYQAFYDGLTCLALARRTSSLIKRRRYVARARRSLKKLQQWAKKAPSNFADKVLLLEAELACVARDYRKAYAKYESAMELSKKEGFVNDQAIACERMADTLGMCGDHDSSLKHLRQARDLYQRWGATAKVKQLDRMLSVDVRGCGGWCP